MIAAVNFASTTCDVAHRACHQRFKRSGIFFQRKQPHRDDRRGKQDDQPIAEAEKNFRDWHRRRFRLQLTQEDDETQSRQKDSPRDDNVTGPRNKKSSQFPPGECQVSLHQCVSSSLSGRVTRI